VKALKNIVEKKTAGTLAVERHRPLMNKLSEAARRRLRRRAAELFDWPLTRTCRSIWQV
jgi:hypothetical protein